MLEHNEGVKGNADIATPFPGASMFNNLTAAALTHAGQTFGHFCADWQREMGNFISMRTKADMELSSTLAGCHNLADVVGAQQAWLATATQDYAHESRRLAAIGAAAMQDGVMSWLTALQPASTQTARHESM